MSIISDQQGIQWDAIRRIAEIWQLDEARTAWSASSTTEADGFDWWPGDFRVRVRAHRPSDQATADSFKLIVRTDCLKDIPTSERRFVELCAAYSCSSTSTYAWVYPPASFLKRFEPTDESANFWFQGTAYISPENISWVTELFARASIMQPINAQIQTKYLRELFGDGIPDIRRPDALRDAPLDAILEIAAQVYVPLGNERSRWDGSDEFEAFAEKWGRSDRSFGFGDPGGLTIETPFGGDSAIIELRTNEKHPQLGHGLLATLRLPSISDFLTIAEQSAALNLLEAATWTGFPQLGCWHVRQYTEDKYLLAFTLFLPNALYMKGLATQVAFWFLERARWSREALFPSLLDQTMAEILMRRQSAISQLRRPN